MLVKMYINAHYICAMCRNSKSVAKKVAIFNIGYIMKNDEVIVIAGYVMVN